MKIENYLKQNEEWPQDGQHIMAQYTDEYIIVYQSYRPAIGNFAVENQYFGGPFKLTRMTWIKPNFLWMMYRNGWGKKEGQEVVLAIYLKRKAFDNYLKEAIHSSYKKVYGSQEEWKQKVQNSDVRLQWDPDHYPDGSKTERRAIQIGLRGNAIETYSKTDIIKIVDISDFVKKQYEHVQKNELEKLEIPSERPYVINDQEALTIFN